MNSQRTLEIIRDELKSDSLKECEGTYWDSRHPHLFVVMGASVSLHKKLLSISFNLFMTISSSFVG